jgi:hypothetical protein
MTTMPSWIRISTVVAVLALVLPHPQVAGQTGPVAPDACVTPVAVDGHEPPCNPHLGQGPWATSHRGPYAQASSPFPGPSGPAELVDVHHDFLTDVPI